MKKLNLLILQSILILSLSILSVSVSAQYVNSGFKVENTDIYEQIKRHKSSNVRIEGEKLAEFANSIIDKTGVNYRVEMDNKICESVDKEFNKTKNINLNQLYMKGSFVPEIGDKTVLNFPISKQNKGACGECFINLPQASATEKYFMLILQKNLLNFHIPDGFTYKKVSLVDNKNLSEIKNFWIIPFQTTPIAVSNDGTILYTNIDYQGLDELAYQIFSNGVIQFVAKEQIDLKEKTEKLKDFPQDINVKNLTYMSFGSGEGKRTLKFSAPCNK